MRIIKLLKSEYFWLGLIIILGFLVRLYKIDSPIADWHSWRQADTAAVTRNFIKEGFTPFLPKYDDASGVSETPIINPSRFRFVEFPIYSITVYPLYLLFGVNELYHRLVSALFSLGSLVFVYLISKRYANISTALFAAFIFALLPYNVFFSRTILPEPTFVFFALGMLYFLDRWILDKRVLWGIWGYIFMALSFLMKPWAIFFYIPLFYSIFTKGGKSWPLLKRFLIFSFLAILPFIFWRLWILQQPEGIPASSWLLNGDGIRFRPAFFWWIISERIGREILGVTGFALFIIGILVKPIKNYFLHIWLLSIFLYFAIFATGNVRHDYYQILFVPIASIILANGFITLVKGGNLFIPRIWSIILALILFPLCFYFGFKIVKEFYKINNPAIIEAGKLSDMILSENALVLAPYNGDTAFLYQINRPGWPVVPLSIKEMVTDYGVTNYVTVAKDEQANWVRRHFKVLVDDPKIMIADLTTLTQKLDDIKDPQP